MKMFTRWRYAVAPIALALFVASCSEQSRNPVSPDFRPAPPQGPVSALNTAGNGPGQCLKADVEDYYGSGPVNCTANDVSIAETVVSEYSFTGDAGSFVPLAPGERIACTQGQHIFVRTAAILENSAQERYDIGVWISLGLTPADTSALNGENCNHYNIVVPSPGATDLDGDACNDMQQGATATVDLDVLELVCNDPDNNGALELKGCVAWDNSNTGQAAAHACPVSDDPENTPPPGGPTDRQGFVWGTLPNTPAKCNCEPFLLPIDVSQVAKLEVVKACVPTNDNGTFDLDIDGGALEVDDGACGATTGAVEVGAGSTSSPGAVHTFSESGFTTSNYASSWSCVNRVGGGARGSGSSLGPNEITLQPNDDVVCTFTNTRHPTLTVNKVCAPTDDAGLFNLQIDGSTAGTGANAACGGTTGAVQTTTGAHTVGETAGTATDLADYVTTISGACASDGSITLSAGQQAVCTITNTRRGSITIVKDVQNPETSAVDFGFTATGAGMTSPFSLDDDADGTLPNSITFSGLAPGGSRTVTEDANSNWDLTAINCVGGASASGNTATRTATVTLGAGENVTCTFVNQRRARLIVDKVVVGADASFDFTREGGSNFSLTGAADPYDTGFTLAPDTYTVCEVNLAAGWADPTATLDAAPAALYNPDDPFLLGNFCVDVELGYGDSKTVVVTNERLPGDGGTRTIGYWKNWSSCSKGNQFAKATAAGTPEATLDHYLGAGSSIFPIGNIAGPITCEEAVALLNKDAITGAKRAGDPIYSMVAQLLAAKLNLAAGAGTCAALSDALDDAQDLLIAIGFNGTGSYSKNNALSAAQRAEANTLAGILGSYNEGTLGGGCPSHV